MEDNPWIGFIGGYFGAIFGGIVSGLFTFLGIRYTIKNNEKENFLATYFERKFILDDAISELTAQISAMKFNEDSPIQVKIDIVETFRPDLNRITNHL